jgi:hypothetical protein
MPKHLKGHAALAALSAVTLVTSALGVTGAKGTELAATLSPSARGIQLAYADLNKLSPTLEVSLVSLKICSTYDPRFGKITVSCTIAEAYRALPQEVKDRLRNPDHGKKVRLATFIDLAKHPTRTMMCPW